MMEPVDNRRSKFGDDDLNKPAKLAIKRAFDHLIASTRITAKQSELNVIEANPMLALGGNDDFMALSNTSWFLIEDNANFEVDEELAEDVEVGAIVDPSNPPQKGCNGPFIRWFLLQYFIQQLPFRLLTFILIIADSALIIADIIIDCSTSDISRWLSNIDFGISCYFVIEIFIRMFALMPKVFFRMKNWFNVADFIIVVVTFFVSLVYTIAIEYAVSQGVSCYQDEVDPDETEGNNFLTILRVLVTLRFVRFIRLIRLVRLYSEHRQIKRSIKQTISQHKKKHRNDGLDLDLTYINTRIIAMSLPLNAWKSMVRRNVKALVDFLDRYHGENYKVYNLCSEKTYEDEWFHDRVSHWPIDDHNVPTMKAMVDFVEDVSDWLKSDPKNVAAIHCGEGKGRTGTMICVLLIHFDLFKNALKSLEYFGQRRSVKHISERFQGVETASQVRYVIYFERLKMLGIKHPGEVWMKFQEIRIRGLRNVGTGNGSDLTMKISTGTTNSLFVANLGYEEAADGSYSDEYYWEEDVFVIKIPKCPKVANDVRIKFYCTSHSVPKLYENCAFYFWFHTFFLERRPPKLNVSSTRRSLRHKNRLSDRLRCLYLSREEIDNAHKEKTWKVFSRDFAIEIIMRIVDGRKHSKDSTRAIRLMEK